MYKFDAKLKWLAIVFSALIIMSFIFMWWMSFSNFRGSYHEIKQQYYGIVAKQVASELESSIKYGKSLDSFYNINGVFDKVASLLSGDVKAAIANREGSILYNSFGNGKNGQPYSSALSNESVVGSLRNSDGSRDYVTLRQGQFEIMILPIHNKSNAVIGSFLLIYSNAQMDSELRLQQVESLKLTLLVMLAPLLILIGFLILNAAKGEKDKARGTANKEMKWRNPQYFVPVVVVLGIAFQSIIMYGQYQQIYKSTISDGAQGILNYMEKTINSVHERGIKYEKMYGLSEYLTEKARHTPIIWNIRISRTIADTKQALERQDEWSISKRLVSEADGENVQIEIQISQQYMSQKMTGMLLVFLVTIIIAGIIIVEIMRLPDVLMFRRGELHNSENAEQYEKMTPILRITSFLLFMGVYASMPFSSVLIQQWNMKLFGLSPDAASSLPITIELLTVMVFSLILPRIGQGCRLKTNLYSSCVMIVVGNLLCAVATGPLMLILFRVICGIGFAGLKYVTNSIISYGTDGSERTTLNIAGMNAGLMGGIMCGGSLGAVVANSMGTSFSYVFTAGIVAVYIIILAYTAPWKLLAKNMPANAATEAKPKSNIKSLMNWPVLRYLAMVTLPLNLGLMFIVSFIPSYIQKVNLPVLLVSYAYLINGLAGIYLGPVLARLLTKKLGRSVCISIMLVLGAVSMLCLSIKPGIALILLSTAIMGLFDGFGSPVSADYFIEMPAIKNKVDVASSLAVLGVMGNGIQMLSPMVYSWAIMNSGAAGFNSIIIVGTVYLAFSILFMMTSGDTFKRPKITAGM